LGELGRVAQRTLEQRQILINNISVRRATEELKAVRDYQQIRRILEAAFGSNDFDGFDVKFNFSPGEFHRAEALDPGSAFRGEVNIHWDKKREFRSLEELAVWTLALDLVSSSNRRRGILTLRRLYSQRDLQLDINLLTSVFPIALADALERCLESSVQVISHSADQELIVAQAG
jgi:hypothetical protein